ncbi:MAG TPA: hypothetical protein VJ921_01800 [Vicinamibacteria bacterium]|nr:hypothetical protein [Vicinamibacteria bacterium]
MTRESGGDGMEKQQVTSTSILDEDKQEVVVPRHCTLAGFTESMADRKGLNVSRLEPLTRIEVRTRNSVYDITVLHPNHWKILVRGGRFFPTETAAYLCGSGYGGTLLKVAWIGVGLCCELSTDGLRVVTSPVEDVQIIEKPLPGPF